jgi:hypothetical protein
MNMDVDLTADDGTTYVALLYGEETDYTAEIIAIGDLPKNVRPYAPPEDCGVAVTNRRRANSLGDVTTRF